MSDTKPLRRQQIGIAGELPAKAEGVGLPNVASPLKLPLSFL